MARSGKSKVAASSIGKGNVTPIQIAFIVERYLTDNNYKNTVSAFRAEASDLFTKTKGKEVPKGLLGLADILDDYVTLKAQKLMVDQEKRRVEKAFQGLQDVMRTYHSLPQSPVLLPPQDQTVTTPDGVICIETIPSNASPPPLPPSQGHITHGSSITNYVQTSIVPPCVEETNKFSTPVPNSSTAKKRRASKAAPKVPPPPKKSRAESPTDLGGTSLTRKVQKRNNIQNFLENAPAVQSTSTSSMVQAPVQGSLIAKSLFRNPPEARENSSSPKTPPQGTQCQSVEQSLNTVVDPSDAQKVAPTSCSIISSETIIISPFKHKGYYSVERSYHRVSSSSPLKSNSEPNRREHVKSRLDFDDSVAPQIAEESAAVESSPSTTDGETEGNFEFDFGDLDFLDGDISKLLVDIDLECDQFHSSQHSSVPANLLPGLEQNVGNEGLEINEGCQALPDSSLSTVRGIISQKGMEYQGQDTVTTLRSITKRIMISSPSKASSSSNCSSGKIESPAKS